MEYHLQVSYPPYIFEVCLFDKVEDTKSKATFGNGVLKFQLVKKSSLEWNQLLASESDNKEFMKAKREEAVSKAHRRAEEEKERKAAEKREQEKLALREQMKVGPEKNCIKGKICISKHNNVVKYYGKYNLTFSYLCLIVIHGVSEGRYR